MDDIEIAEQEIELYLADALRRARTETFGFPTDECLNCGADLAMYRQRFCDVDCANDWARRAGRMH